MNNLAGNNNKNYYNDVEEGNIFLDYVLDKLHEKGIVTFAYTSRKNQFGKGETKAGIEMKLDKKIEQFGSMFIETDAKDSDGIYRPSGIYAGNNTWLYIQGDYNNAYAFSVKTLRYLHIKKGADGLFYYNRIETPIKTAKGFKLPITAAEKYCEFILKGGI